LLKGIGSRGLSLPFLGLLLPPLLLPAAVKLRPSPCFFSCSRRCYAFFLLPPCRTAPRKLFFFLSFFMISFSSPFFPLFRRKGTHSSSFLYVIPPPVAGPIFTRLSPFPLSTGCTDSLPPSFGNLLLFLRNKEIAAFFPFPFPNLKHILGRTSFFFLLRPPPPHVVTKGNQFPLPFFIPPCSSGRDQNTSPFFPLLEVLASSSKRMSVCLPPFSEPNSFFFFSLFFASSSLNWWKRNVQHSLLYFFPLSF